MRTSESATAVERCAVGVASEAAVGRTDYSDRAGMAIVNESPDESM